MEFLQLSDRELDILVADNDYMAELNERWLSEAGPTDVITIPALPEHTRSLGDVAICWPLVLQSAKVRNVEAGDEAGHLVIHGILHLAGFTHDSPEEYERMRSTALLIASECSLKPTHPFLAPIEEEIAS
jgi:probable rRNA maturation factor